MRWILVVGLLVATAVIGGYLWWASRATVEPTPVVPAVPAAPRPPVEPDAPVAAPPVEQRPAAALPPPPPPIVLPALADSDAFVRDQVGDVPDPLLAEWLAEEDLVRRAVVVLHNATRGEYPKRQLGFVPVRGPFKVRRDGESLFVDTTSYARYDAVVAAATTLPPARVAGLVRLLEPLVSEALRELGVRQDTDSALADAAAMVAATPVLEGPVALVRPNVLYEYADPALEALPPLQKQLLRMGPANLRRVQAYVAEVYDELSLTR